ncbi:MAG: GerW family sporulation protein [Clostridia bacterium]|nr:GerW family sporulation protein [Clostridia bacterium]
MSTPIEELMNEAMKNIRSMVDANTIVGEVITTPDGTTIIPITRVSVGFGAGGSEFGAKPEVHGENGKMFGGGTGGGVSMNPVAFLVVTKDSVRILPVSSTMSTVERIVDTMPELMGKFNSFVNDMADRRAAKKQSKSTIELTEE